MGPAHRFLGWCDIGMMPDDGRHGEGQHDQGNMAVPAVPRARLVVIEAKRVLRGLETVLDRPAVASIRTSVSMACPAGTRSRRRPDRVRDIAADQQTSGPELAEIRVESAASRSASSI